MQVTTIAGKLGKDAATATTQGGDHVCNFSVAVDTWDGREKGTQWWRVALWGKRGQGVAPYLLKGVSVTVSGSMSLEEYEGKPQLNLRASEVTLQGQRQQSGGQQSDGGSSNQQRGNDWQNDTRDDLDDDIPFVTNDPTYDHFGA